jgi:hypothetical protein
MDSTGAYLNRLSKESSHQKNKDTEEIATTQIESKPAVSNEELKSAVDL